MIRSPAARATALLVALVLSTATLGALAEPAGAAATAANPASWDKRILALVKFVEKTRKLRFEHPIPVEFLSDAAFRKRIRNDNQKVTAADKRDARRSAEELRALGLIQGKVDLIGSEKNLSGADVLGYYDQDKKKMVIRGTSLAHTDVRVTVAHELTHALQDQHFNLNKLTDATKTSGADTALTALIEGDATRVEDAYVASLSKSEQDAYNKTLDQQASAETPGVAGTALADVPPILGLLDEAPYDFGTPFVDALAAKNGAAGIDGAFRHPPVSDLEIIDPVVYFDSQTPLHVATPKLDPGDQRLGDPDDFGALSLFFMLVARSDFPTALGATEAWGGDTFVAFRRDHHTCVRIAFRSRSSSGTRRLTSALQTWAAAGPAGAATVATPASGVTLTACDLGGGTAPSYDTLSNAVTVLSGRVEVIGQFIDAGAPPSTATCIADRFVVDPKLAPLLRQDTLSATEQDTVTKAFRDFASTCTGT